MSIYITEVNVFCLYVKQAPAVLFDRLKGHPMLTNRLKRLIRRLMIYYNRRLSFKPYSVFCYCIQVHSAWLPPWLTAFGVGFQIVIFRVFRLCLKASGLTTLLSCSLMRRAIGESVESRLLRRLSKRLFSYYCVCHLFKVVIHILVKLYIIILCL